LDFNVGPGFKFGYGLLLNTEDIPGRRAAWSGAWAGLCNTHFWVDRTTGVTGAIYTQTLPFVAAAAFQMYTNFETALDACLQRYGPQLQASSQPLQLGRRVVVELSSECGWVNDG
jgi:CubicO group peptidase (beta-lactamase class C family)